MNQTPSKPVYEAPRVVHKGSLKQFSGSPLSAQDGGVLGVPGN